MANEIRTTVSLFTQKSGSAVNMSNTSVVSMSGSNYIMDTQVIGTSFVSMVTGSCTNIRYAYIDNLSSASIDIAVNATSNSFANLRPGDAMLLPLSASSCFLKSTLAGAIVQVGVTER
jgi:hypothetical protein